MRQSTSYSMPSTTTPCSVSRSTPRPVGVDQVHVRPVERRQVLVVEARPLAELAVPRLQLLGRRRVLDDRRRRGRGPAPSSGSRRAPSARPFSSAESRRPSWRLAVLAAMPVSLRKMSVQPSATRSSSWSPPLTRMLKLSIRRCCQPGVERGGPVGIGLAVVAHVDRRRRALEDVELLGRLAEVGDALDRRGAGADDADALVGELVEVPVGVAAGVARSPSGWCGTCGPGSR